MMRSLQCLIFLPLLRSFFFRRRKNMFWSSNISSSAGHPYSVFTTYFFSPDLYMTFGRIIVCSFGISNYNGCNAFNYFHWLWTNIVNIVVTAMTSSSFNIGFQYICNIQVLSEIKKRFSRTLNSPQFYVKISTERKKY